MPKATQIGELFGSMAGLFAGGVGARMSQLGPWVTRVAAGATEKWTAVIMANVRCTHCRAQSVVSCSRCSAPACLEHAWISPDADAACIGCMAELLGRPKSKRAAAGTPPDPCAAAYETLGLTPEASWEEINQRFREISLKKHPDRFPSGARRKKAEEEFKRVVMAFEVLKQRRAAA